MFCGINFMTSGFLCTSQSTFSFLISGFCSQNCTFLKNEEKRNHLVHFCYCHYVIKYLMRDIMNYHCLRVLRSRDRRIGKQSPGFSVFRNRVMAVRMLSRALFRSRAPSGRYSFLAISIIHARQVINKV